MNEYLLEKICDELGKCLAECRFGKVFTLSKRSIAVDFRSADGRFLYISAEPTSPRVYLIRRRLRDLERSSSNPSQFALTLRKRLSGSRIGKIFKLENERVLKFEMSGRDDFGAETRHCLVIQLTGKSSNVFLLGENDAIIDRLRETHGAGQEIGTLYSPPARPNASVRSDSANEVPEFGDRGVSEFLDEQFLHLESERAFSELASRARRKAADSQKRLKKLIASLERDLETHGDAAEWKKKGDLILANLADAIIVDGKLLVVDYFEESTPTIEIEIDETDSLTEAAEKFFRRYTKARNARAELSRRIDETRRRISEAEEVSQAIERAVSDRDDAFLQGFVGDGNIAAQASLKAEKRRDGFNGARRFRSTDGLEILVGKASKDNDALTFKVAKSLDTWLHAADYPGSHVIIRNPSRAEIPQKTLLEAAQLAAFYSHARQHPKAAVHYTLRKFVNKPKGATAGLVSLASFKTILVEPGVNVEKIDS